MRFLQESPMPTQSTTKPLEFEGFREAFQNCGKR